VTWSSTSQHLNLSPQGASAMIEGISAGTAIVTATGQGYTATAQVTINAGPTATLVSIAVTPSTPSIAAGRTVTLTATGTYSDDTTADLTSTATWTSSSTSVATVAAGVVTGVTVGEAEITAAVGTVSGTATVTVTAAELESIEVEPATQSLAAGLTQQYVATGIYSDNSNADITGDVTWTSSDTDVATIDTAGLASTVAEGSTTITAALGGIDGTATLTVTDAVLVSIDLTPPDPVLAEGTTVQLTAEGLFSDGSVRPLTGLSWESSDTAAATVSQSGLVEGIAAGQATITATDPTTGIDGTVVVTVTSATLVSIEIEPANPSVPRTTTLTFTARGVFSDGTTQILTGVSWDSSNTTVATITATGFTATPGVGTSTITATDPTTNISGSTLLTVTAATLERIEVTPFVITLPRGTFEAFVATGVYSDATTQDLTESVTWSSSMTTVATISNGNGTAGIATTIAPGTTTITAFDATSGLSATATLIVGNSVLVSIEIVPADPTLPKGSKLQFTAIGHYDDGTTRILTDFLSWSASSPNIASISTATRKKGLASAKNVGTTDVIATDTTSGLQGTTTLTVTNATLQSIVLSPLDSTIPLRTRQYFTATGVYSDSSTADLTTVVSWTSSNTTVATISNQTFFQGAATGLAAGTTTITATDTASGVSASTTLTVSSATLVSIAITPADPNVILGLTQQMAATGTFSDNSTHDVTREVTWSSTSTQVASISNATPGKGVLTALAVGSTTIAAQFPQTTISGSTVVTVIP
jgi:trimeric autotransporter adhesin